MTLYSSKSLAFFFKFIIIIILLYNIVLVLPYINMHPPWVYMYSSSWTPLPHPSPYHPSGFFFYSSKSLALRQALKNLISISKYHASQHEVFICNLCEFSGMCPWLLLSSLLWIFPSQTFLRFPPSKPGFTPCVLWFLLGLLPCYHIFPYN